MPMAFGIRAPQRYPVCTCNQTISTQTKILPAIAGADPRSRPERPCAQEAIRGFGHLHPAGFLAPYIEGVSRDATWRSRVSTRKSNVPLTFYSAGVPTEIGLGFTDAPIVEFEDELQSATTLQDIIVPDSFMSDPRESMNCRP
ncbi:hypothetical protein PUNSTDRAFT_55372 [Punctularia strigosozonata HHB-11173 SS5]|uniref:Uncharacterized protein n=1 Tax=Punctularia strigosozonata (strain HHB-11173) TaxID=741275 RepID=R7S5G4_PUNST|nr:uncharacterized protein PUNSTDRAFT_55372 [Punctularia strigosozonata HHB-11173 SS5]EIN04646.1 hypothetical protein PUNSTDRAFT_55372 [Punctularia strigosozonata HHB-11173 SS5]